MCDNGRVTGNELKERREALGFTQTELADKLKMSHSSIWRWEKLKDKEIPMSGVLEYAMEYFVEEKRRLLMTMLAKHSGIDSLDPDFEK